MIHGFPVRARLLAVLLIAILCVWSVAVSATIVELEHPLSCHREAVTPAAHHESMAGHDCCPRPAPAPKKTCCPHTEGLAPRSCGVGGECCRIEAREVTSTRSDRNQRKRQQEQAKKDGAARPPAALSSSEKSRAFLTEGVRYECPVNQQKTDWRT